MGLPVSGGLTKLGAGALTLRATNTYTGPTEVRDGVLRLKDVAVLSRLSSVSVTGGCLDLGGGTLSNGNVTVNGGGSIVNGGVATKVIEKNGPGTLDLSALVTLSTNRAPRVLTLGSGRHDPERLGHDFSQPLSSLMLIPRAAFARKPSTPLRGADCGTVTSTRTSTPVTLEPRVHKRGLVLPRPV
jgi:autotransporter-associated beta strand protein